MTTARVCILGGVAVWLASTVFAWLLVGGPLDFSSAAVLGLIYLGLLLVSSVSICAGVCGRARTWSLSTRQAFIAYLLATLATGAVSYVTVPRACRALVRATISLGVTPHGFVEGYFQMSRIPLWNICLASLGIPLGALAVYLWARSRAQRG